MRHIRLAVLGLILLSAACAAGGGSGDGAPRRNSNLISLEEVTAIGNVGSAYDAVRQLRPNWLTGRGGSGPRVFVNGVDMGGTDVLRNYRATTIREIRFTSPSDATIRYGTNSGGGVIDLITR
jgi:hypothetical protein